MVKRLFLFSVFISIISIAFGQRTEYDSTNRTVCILPVNCWTVLNGKPVKPFIASGEYSGKIIMQAQLDTATMKLIRHKIIYADLHSKLDPNKRIEVRLDEHSGDTKYLDTILPDLINHLKYLKFKLVGHSGCVMTTSWKFPITIKQTDANR